MSAFILGWSVWIYNNSYTFLNLLGRVIKAVYNEIYVKKEWVFLKDIIVPLPLTQFKLGDTTRIRWNASINPPRLYTDPGQDKHLQWLGFSITFPDKTTFDITDWINDVKWSSTGPEPSPLDIYLLWCCDKGYPYFNNIEDVTVTLILDDGSVIVKGLNEYNDIYTHGRRD